MLRPGHVIPAALSTILLVACEPEVPPATPPPVAPPPAETAPAPPPGRLPLEGVRVEVTDTKIRVFQR